jgi:signal transduction histidine kinase
MPPTPPSDRPVRVLLVARDRGDYQRAVSLLSQVQGGRFELDWVPEYDAALEALGRGQHDLYLIDQGLSPRSGLELLQEARRRGSRGPVILLTARGLREIDDAALKAGAADYIEKDRLDPTLLDRAIRYALRQAAAEAGLEAKVRERTDDLARANAALQEGDRRKNEFLGALGHELRNPLAPIRNALEIMRLAPDQPAVLDQCRSLLERQVKQLVRLIDDLLDVSRITRGALRVEREEMDLADALDAALEQARPAIEKAGLALEVSRPEGRLPLLGDRVRLAQALSNVLNNAAKYTPPGGRVALAARREGGEAVVAVRDTGIGIPAEMLPRVFELFTRVDRELNRPQEGLGVGLAIASRIVEKHGGRLEAHSGGEGQGAEFVFRLPLAEGAPASA